MLQLSCLFHLKISLQVLQRLGTNGLAGWGRCSTFGDQHDELGDVHRVYGVVSQTTI